MEQSSVVHIPTPSSFPIKLFFLGKSVCMPQHSVSNHIRQNYVLHFITNGKGIFSIDGHIYHLHKNQGFFIPPDIPIYYQANADEPWEYFWIGIDGSGLEQFLSHLGLTSHSPIFQYSQAEKLLSLIDKMLMITPNTLENKLKLQGLLFLFLAQAAACCLPATTETQNYTNIHIEKAITFIQDHYHHPITVEKIANHTSLNRSYLSALFRQEMGISIQDYLTNYRISKAAELLLLTEDSIHSIAYSCGYNDSLTFSKAFKRLKGVSPTDYRHKEQMYYNYK